VRVLIAGGSGLIGTALAESLARDGHEAVVLSRDPTRHRLPPGVRAAGWNAHTLGAWVESEMAPADAVVTLAGESIFGRWTAAKKRRLYASRVDTSRLIADAIAAASRRPRVLLQGSAIGYYGDTGDREVDESSLPGDDFLARLTVDWEAASAAVERLGVRRPIARTSIVLSRRGGALGKLRRVYCAFLGGPVGNGRQWMPWIHVTDEVAALRFLLDAPDATGPFDLVSPEPARNADFGRAVGRALRRPSFLPVPAFALRLVFGELADSLVGGTRAAPRRLLALGYRFRFPQLDRALRDALA
jgi:uncharacterized protein (TIGR01777 family)